MRYAIAILAALMAPLLHAQNVADDPVPLNMSTVTQVASDVSSSTPPMSNKWIVEFQANALTVFPAPELPSHYRIQISSGSYLREITVQSELDMTCNTQTPAPDDLCWYVGSFTLPAGDYSVKVRQLASALVPAGGALLPLTLHGDWGPSFAFTVIP